MKGKRYWTLLFLVATLTILSSCSPSQPASNQSPEAGTQTPVWVTQSQNLVNATITVPSGQWYYCPFSVNVNTMQNARVVGSFQASGGSGNDIIALIMDDMAYTNWSNGHQVNVLYSSGQLTAANINVPISSSGSYYLVFSNNFSLFTSKQVSTTVNLTWSELRYK